jgi:hypothetical protein
MRNEQQRQASDNSRVGVRHDTMFPPLLRSGCSDPVAKSGDSPPKHLGTKERVVMKLIPLSLAVVLTTAVGAVQAGELNVVGSINVASNLTTVSMTLSGRVSVLQQYDNTGRLHLNGNAFQQIGTVFSSTRGTIGLHEAGYVFANMQSDGMPEGLYFGVADYVTHPPEVIIQQLGLRANGVEVFTGGLSVPGNGNFGGDLNIDGKVYANGGIDPPYLLLDNETRASIADRVGREVPPSKQSGAALFWNSQTRQLEIYVASEGAFYNLTGKLITAIAPVFVKGATVTRTFRIDAQTGTVVERDRVNVPRWQLKPGYKFDSQTGAFTYLSGSNAVPVTVTAQDALELK